MTTVSTWWTEGHRIHIQGSFGIIRIAPIVVGVNVDDVLAKIVEGLLHRGDDDAGDLRCLLVGRLVRSDLDHPHVEIESGTFQAINRALLEHVDLSEGHILVQAQKRLSYDPARIAQFFADRGGEIVQISAGIILFHWIVPRLLRVTAKERAARRAQFVDEAIAHHHARRGQRRMARAA